MDAKIKKCMVESEKWVVGEMGSRTDAMRPYRRASTTFEE